MAGQHDSEGLKRSPTDEPPRLAWHHARPDEVAAYWQSNLESGLSDEVAALRLSQLGENRLSELPPPSSWALLWAQLSDFTVLTLLVAAAIAAALGAFMSPGANFLARFGDALAILAIVLINAILGLWQARHAERSLSALRTLTAPAARVLRNGRVCEIRAAALVAGDVLLIEEGDRVAADGRLFQSHDLEVDEATLTGESVPVGKEAAATLDRETPLAERRNMVFMGTRVTRGRAYALVTNTGIYTELGAVAGMLSRVEAEKTPLEKDLDRFGKRIVLGCVAVSGVVFLAGLAEGRASVRELFLVAVALAVAAIPEGLPAVTTIVLALGASRMAKRRALVRRLPAVETLGCAQVICTDKTGTLTQNAMTARRLWVGGQTLEVRGEPRRIDGGVSSDPGELAVVLEAAAFAGGAHLTILESGEVEVQGDPTDAALQIMSLRQGVRATAKVAAEQPFTSDRRMASVLVRKEGLARAYVRGAPEVILARSSRKLDGGGAALLDENSRSAALATAADWSAHSMRVVALAYHDLATDPESAQSSEGAHEDWEQELVFLALVGIVDPPRPEAAGAIAQARQAGIRSLMITGDHPATARAIAEEIGLWEPQDLLLSGGELDAMDQQRLEASVDRLRVVARATAEHKLRIVNALRARGLVCAMTGDGVNDAPAVKAASIGVAMGRAGTDVTREAAALVLADDNFATIVAAIEEGRAIYANIRKFIFFLLSSNIGAVLFVLLASLFGWEEPLAPIQILWINLITNGLPALALGVDGRDPEQMRAPPREPGGAILSPREYVQMAAVGALMALIALAAFAGSLGDPRHAASPEALAHARAIAFSLLAVSPLAHAFNCRSKSRSLFSLGVFSNRALWGAVAVGLGLQAVTLYVPALRLVFQTAPLSLRELALVGALALVPFVAVEAVKLLRAVALGAGRGRAGA